MFEKLDSTKMLTCFPPQLGVTDLITAGQADLSGVAGEPGDMHVSSVVHKAVLEVNEEGAEAAAATGEYSFLYF